MGLRSWPIITGCDTKFLSWLSEVLGKFDLFLGEILGFIWLVGDWSFPEEL